MDFRIEHKDSFKIIGHKSVGNWDEWGKFFDNIHPKLADGGYYKAPFWQVWAFNVNQTECNTIVGTEYNDEPLIDGTEIEEYPAAPWAVFDACKIYGKEADVGDSAGKTYAKVISEWLPLSNYIKKRALTVS